MQTRWLNMADPVHGLMRFDRYDETHRMVLDVVNTQAFQRLRRIKQMGLAEFVFPGATHNRFIHSLGATHLMAETLRHLHSKPESRKFLEANLDGTDIPLERLLMLGILIHDIGHGPLSHTLEDILGLRKKGMHHDSYWNQRILTEDPELLDVWDQYDPQLAEAVLKFTGDDGQHQKHFMAELISSQLDMDRLDYLQRDSHFLGVQYGRIEAERIITSLEVAPQDNNNNGEHVLAVRAEAIPAVEHYLFGRHQAYKMALHPLDKASESLLRKVLERFGWVRDQGQDPGYDAEELYKLMTEGKDLTIDEYLRLDDCYLWSAIQCWSLKAKDEVLKTLSTRILRHEIFKYVDLGHYNYTQPLETLPEVWNALQHHYESRGLSFEFGFQELVVKSKPLYQTMPHKRPIWIKSAHNGLSDLSDISTLPLFAEPPHSRKHLVFVWDREAKRFLTQALNQHFKVVV